MLWLLLILFNYGCTAFELEVIDLTHPVDENTIAWPTATKFSAKQVFKNITSGGYWYENRDISSSEHAGTHLDAPNHIRDSEGGWDVASIPVERLSGPGVKIDISKQSKENVDYQLTRKDVENWEKEFGTIPEKSIVLIHTGRGELYTNRQKYLGYPDGLAVEADDTEHLHFPGVGPDAATLFVERKVYGVGIDTPSTDFGQSKEYMTHRILHGANLWGLENVARSNLLPPKGFYIHNMVYKLNGGSGGPTRVIAVLNYNGSSGSVRLSDWLPVLLLLLIQCSTSY